MYSVSFLHIYWNTFRKGHYDFSADRHSVEWSAPALGKEGVRVNIVSCTKVEQAYVCPVARCYASVKAETPARVYRHHFDKALEGDCSAEYQMSVEHRECRLETDNSHCAAFQSA